MMVEDTAGAVQNDRLDIVGYGTGRATTAEFNAAIAAGWTDIVADPAQLEAIAAILGVSAAYLQTAAAPPVLARNFQAGTADVDIAVMVFTYIGTDLVWPAFRDIAKDEIKRRIKQCWSDYLEPAVRDQLRDRHALGDRKEPPPLNW